MLLRCALVLSLVVLAPGLSVAAPATYARTARQAMVGQERAYPSPIWYTPRS